jgi:sugar lactone lactonase YvrE
MNARTVAEGHSFLEGPRWHGGRLYASDFFTHRVLAFEADGAAETVCHVPGRPSGLGWMPDGSMLISSMVDRRLLRLVDGELVTVAELRDHAAWHCNDLIVDGQGRAYVGEFGWDEGADPTIQPGRILRVDPGGAVSVAADGLVFPNGMAITPDGRTMLVAETFAARISAFDRDGDGALSGRRTWAAFSDREFATTVEAIAAGVPLPDGIALDAEGALWVADAVGPAAIRVREGGEIVDAVATGEQASFAVALGGDDRRTLYVCAAVPYGSGDPSAHYAARLLAAQVEVPGAR